jgi:hypothetical protein
MTGAPHEEGPRVLSGEALRVLCPHHIDRCDSVDWIFIRVAPSWVQAWHDADEVAGRTVMVDGAWKEIT